MVIAGRMALKKETTERKETTESTARSGIESADVCDIVVVFVVPALSLDSKEYCGLHFVTPKSGEACCGGAERE